MRASEAPETERPGLHLAEMRRDWDRRGREDHRLHIATGHAATAEEFRVSGEQDLDELILDGLRLLPGAQALEIGCGVGRLLRPLSARVERAWGVDISPVMVEKSREYLAGLPNVTTSVTDGTLSDVEDSSLDLVYSFIVFQHVPSRSAIETYVHEASRTLRPGGVLRFQVDGRWMEHPGRRPDTYDGLTLQPEAVRTLLSGTDLHVVDEWGEETRYHWVTAVESGEPEARVALVPRVWDVPMVADLLSRAGVEDAEEIAVLVANRKMGLRRALGSVELRLAALSATSVVENAYRLLLGRPPDGAGLSWNASMLARGLEDESSLVDTLFLGLEMRDLLRPFDCPVPWSVREEVLERLGRPGTVAGFLDLAGLVEEAILGADLIEAAARASRLVLGRDAGVDELTHNAALVTRHPRGRRLLARRLVADLALGSTAPPGPPSAATQAGLYARTQMPAGQPRQPGESFAGEGDIAAALLRETAGRSLPVLLRAAYRRILGRPPDPDGEAFWLSRLTSGELTRAAFLRHLLWSDELRRD